MLQRFFQAIQNFFLALFGSKSSDTSSTADRPEQEKPQQPDTIPVVKPHEIPQDGSEIEPDTPAVEEVSEEEEVTIDPEEEDIEFEEDEIGEEIIIDEEELDIEDTEPADTQPDQRYLWCLDNGHGILTTGKRSPFFGEDGRLQFREYEFNRDIVARIMKALDERGIQYYNVVPEVEIGDFLEGRVRRANGKKSSIPKIFVSIHSNAGPAATPNTWTPDNVSGVETWYFHSSKKGQKVAGVFQKHIVEATGWKSRGLKSRANRQFYVLRKTRMTAILTENGFYNNRKQVLELMKDEVRQAIADAHVEAILEIERDAMGNGQ